MAKMYSPTAECSHFLCIRKEAIDTLTPSVPFSGHSISLYIYIYTYLYPLSTLTRIKQCSMHGWDCVWDTRPKRISGRSQIKTKAQLLQVGIFLHNKGVSMYFRNDLIYIHKHDAVMGLLQSGIHGNIRLAGKQKWIIYYTRLRVILGLCN